MKTFALLMIISFTLTACQTARLVSTRMRPVKSGTVVLEGQGPGGRSMAQTEASKIMKGFCAPQRARITGTDEQQQVTGVYANAWGLNGADYQRQVNPLVHFECVDAELGLDD